MAMVAYLIYAFLQSIIVVAMIGVKSGPLRVCSMAFSTLLAPVATIFALFAGVDALISWLQEPKNQP